MHVEEQGTKQQTFAIMLGSGRQEGFLQQQAPNQPRDAEPWVCVDGRRRCIGSHPLMCLLPAQAHVDPSSVLMLTFGTIILFFGGMYLLSGWCVCVAMHFYRQITVHTLAHS